MISRKIYIWSLLLLIFLFLYIAYTVQMINVKDKQMANALDEMYKDNDPTNLYFVGEVVQLTTHEDKALASIQLDRYDRHKDLTGLVLFHEGCNTASILIEYNTLEECPAMGTKFVVTVRQEQ